MHLKKLLIVIPTRNRVELARTAIESVLWQVGCDFRVLVSDNSTEMDQADALREFCDAKQDSRLTYVRPDQALGMAEHWNWALEKGLAENDVTHVSYLTDRMLFAPDAFREIAEILNGRGAKVLTFNTSGVNQTEPYFLEEIVWSGRLFEVPTSSVIEQFAEGLVLYHPMPRMMNSVVPVSVIERVQESFGKCFASISPDFNFGFKVLDVVESTLYYDKSLLFQSGGDRSNGINLMQGIFNKDAVDFLGSLKKPTVHFETPVDDFYIMPNPIMYEYFDVKVASKTGRFPSINREHYLMGLIDSIYSFGDSEIRAKLKAKVFDDLGQTAVHLYRLRSLLRRKLIGGRLRLQNMLFKESIYYRKTTYETFADAVNAIRVKPRPAYRGPDFLRERFGALSPIRVIENSELGKKRGSDE